MASTTATAALRFGEVLRRHRQAAGLTQAELAERASLSKRGINDLERGVRQAPRKDTVVLLVEALSLDAEERTAFVAAARRSGVDTSALSAAAAPSGSQGEGTAAASALPTGTVTFLFTDLEGSTHLLQQLGPARYAQTLASMRRLLGAACAQHPGVAVDATGDGRFFAFAQAPEAVAAAAQAQRALAAHQWPEGARVRMRMGLHTGTAQVVGEHYIGLDVHRAARIAAAGHGRQVLLSEAARGLAEPELPDGATLRDLGVHRLKDLQRPEHLYQLVLPSVPGLPADFPPLATLEAHPHNLPIQPTQLVGREQEVAAVCALLRREEVRLVTLTGVGGVGKTRLGLQVAAELVDDFPDGVWFVSLSRLSDPELALPTIAQTLGVRETGSRSIEELLRDYVRARRLLLLLDNFEQVVAAAARVADVLASSPGLKVLATSRGALHLRGEKQVQVRPLPLPDPAHLPPPERLVVYPAVALFVQRAQDADAGVALTNASALAIAAICARVDGLPLAIELAAAKVRVLPPSVLLQRLERRLPLLTGGARDTEARQQTMRATLAWSEDLLEPEEQRLFHRLAVFVGGFTLEAVEAVCAAPEGAEPLGVDVLEGLEALVDQSLVQPWTMDSADGARAEEEEGGESRIRLLYVIREYALGRMETSGEAEALRVAHAAYYLGLAVAAERELAGPHVAVSLRQLEREHDNFRAVLGWVCARGADQAAHQMELGLQLAAALGRFWRACGHLSEGRTWLEELLRVAAPPVRVEVRLLSDADNVVPGAKVPAAAWARAADALGWLALWQGMDVPAAGWLDAAASVAGAAGEPRTSADALFGLGVLALQQRNVAQAATWFESSLTLARETGSSLDIVQGVLRQHGWVAYHQGDLARATAFFQEGFALVQQMGDPWGQSIWQVNLGELALLTGDLAHADTYGREALKGLLALGTSVDIAIALELLAAIAGASRQGERTARLLGAAMTMRMLVGAPLTKAGREELERGTAMARQALGEEAWAAAFAAGRALTLEQAIAEALDETGGA